MNLKISPKKVIASVMALTIVASGVLATDTSLLGKIVQTNIISASAANTITYGDWEYEEINSATAKLTKYNGTDEYVIIPEAIDGHTVTELERRLFQNNTTITRVAIPRGITQIPNSCFKGATNLTSVAIPQAVNKIDMWAFANTPSLNSVSLPTGLEQIGYCAFYNSGISNISILSDTIISDYAFENCVNLKSIKLPNNLTKLELGVFSGCTNLESVTFPESITCIGSESFEGCESLKSVSLPNNLETLEYGAFKGCTSLESVTIPASVTWLGDKLFANCTSLKTATFQKYPDRLTGYIFENCTALENINYPNDDNRFIHDIIYTGMVEGCPNFKKVNNENIVTYESHRYNPYAKPVMRADFMEEVMQDFAYVDERRLSFFEEYLQAKIKYIAGTNTHIIGSSTVLTTTQKIKALHDWVCNNVSYAYDSNRKPDLSWKNAYDSTVFMQDKAVCEGYARALTLLLRAEGIESYLLYSDTHAWCMVKIGDYYLHVDPCHDDTTGGICYGHFLLSDKDISDLDDSHSKWEIASPWNSRIDYTISPMPTCDCSIGDANMNGNIDEDDVQLIQDYISNTVPMPDPSSPEFLFADVNFNGKIDWDDADTIDSWIAPIV